MEPERLSRSVTLSYDIDILQYLHHPLSSQKLQPKRKAVTIKRFIPSNWRKPWIFSCSKREGKTLVSSTEWRTKAKNLEEKIRPNTWQFTNFCLRYLENFIISSKTLNPNMTLPTPPTQNIFTDAFSARSHPVIHIIVFYHWQVL